MTVAFIPRSLISSSRVMKARTAARSPKSAGATNRARTSIEANVSSFVPTKDAMDQAMPPRRDEPEAEGAAASPAAATTPPPASLTSRPAKPRCPHGRRRESADLGGVTRARSRRHVLVMPDIGPSRNALSASPCPDGLASIGGCRLVERAELDEIPAGCSHRGAWTATPAP